MKVRIIIMYSQCICILPIGTESTTENDREMETSHGKAETAKTPTPGMPCY